MYVPAPRGGSAAMDRRRRGGEEDEERRAEEMGRKKQPTADWGPGLHELCRQGRTRAGK